MEKDISLLEEEIATNPELYSNNSGTMWSSAPGQGGLPDLDWAKATTEFRPETGNGHAASMKSCKSSFNVSSGGKSHKNGFNILLVGYIFNGNSSLSGYNGNYWSGSTYATNDIWIRRFLDTRNGVWRNMYSKNYLKSVRCKKAS